MSSHREAPEISKDPVADSTDLYAFVSPDEPDTVTIIANYVPLEGPDGGPNFYEFGNDVLYAINIDNDNDGDADIVYEFRFETEVTDPNTFLYNTGPIQSLTDPNWNRRQTYSVTRVDNERRVLAEHAPGHRAGLPAVQRRAALDPRLRRTGRGRRAQPVQRRDGVRRAARRGLLRGPRGHLRPRASCGPSSRTTPPSG